MSINDRISQIIAYSKLTPSEFADEIDVQRSNISHIASGRNKPSLDFIIKIKNRFPEIQWDWLIGGEGKMTSNDEPSLSDSENRNEPDLFSIFEERKKEIPISKTFSEPEKEIPNPQETHISAQSPEKEISTDSRKLETETEKKEIQPAENQQVVNSLKVKKIVFFYENGKFEMYEP